MARLTAMTFSWDPPAGPPLALVHVPDAVFLMGGPPAHLHEIAEPYFIGRDPVTRAHFRAFCDATGYVGAVPDGHPAALVTFGEALAYCAWAEVRLPSEAEWELAAGGMDGLRYPHDVSPFGIRPSPWDVGEWVADAHEERAHDRYRSGDFTAPVESADALRVVRFARAGLLPSASAEAGSRSFGFRVAVSADASVAFLPRGAQRMRARL